MTRPRTRGWLLAPLALTAGLTAARVAAVPTLSDPLGGPGPAGVHLVAPPVYLLLAPLFTLWDGVSMLSMSRLHGFLVGTGLLYLVWRMGRLVLPSGRPYRLGRELKVLVLSFAAFALFIALGLLWHRPMLALAGAGPNFVVTDFHTHTNASHDVQGAALSRFDTRANLAWHRRAGFDAVFVTDHNTVAGLRPLPSPPPRLCPGTEVSAWRAHIVLLGDSLPVDRARYSRDWSGLASLLRTSDSVYGALSLASLPEYERNHGRRLDSLVSSGLDGFEIVNAAPKANELSRARRDSVIALARRSGRFVVGVSDHHGWGATSMVWNLVPVPDWRRDPDQVCARVLDRLRSGFGSVRILERHRLRPDSAWPSWLTPLGVIWETWRSMSGPLALSWLAWIWGPALLRRRTR
jgi:hypothetical protein